MSTSLEDLSTELLISVFDYLTPVEVLVAFFGLNERLTRILYHYLQPGFRLTQFNFCHTSLSTYKLCLRSVWSDLRTTTTALQLGSDYHHGQIHSFNHYQVPRLDSLCVRLIDPRQTGDILQKFLNYNRLQWFDRIHLIVDEEARGWDERAPFCVQSVPVREVNITGKAPYVFAQHLMNVCFSITQLTIHLKFDHDLLPLLYYLPNLIEFHAQVDDRGRDISNDLSLLEPLLNLKRFKYEGLLPLVHLRRLVLRVDQGIEHLALHTQDYQWPFHSSEALSADFFDRLLSLRTFDFYVRLILSSRFQPAHACPSETKHLVQRNLCRNIAWFWSKDIGQVLSLPYAFEHFELFDTNFFDQLRYFEHVESNLPVHYWNSISHLTLHNTIYDAVLLKSIEKTFRRLRSVDYRVPQVSLIPEENELLQYDLRLRSVKKLTIRDSVKHGCHVPQPLFLLTSNLAELDLDHFYLMQILSISSQQTRACILSAFARLRRLTVRQFDERLPEQFFSYFPYVEVLALVFVTYKMQVYRTRLPFLDDLLRAMPKLVSLKLEHVKKPHEFYASVQLQDNVIQTFARRYGKDDYWCQWYDDRTQAQHKYGTFFFAT